MKRVVVIGCPGSGKTTFARKLAEKTKLPIIHLDFYHHQTKFDYPNNRPAWVARVRGLMEQESWIIDGNYNSTLKERLKKADTIFFFDLPRRVSFYGVIKRRIQYRNKLRDEMPSDWKEKANLKFLKYVWDFQRNNRGDILDALELNKTKKITIFTSRAQANEYLQKL